MLKLTSLPLSVINRALDLYGEPRCTDANAGYRALISAEGRKDVRPDFPGLTPFGQAVAEDLSLSGPWAEDGGEFSGEGGFQVEL